MRNLRIRDGKEQVKVNQVVGGKVQTIRHISWFLVEFLLHYTIVFGQGMA